MSSLATRVSTIRFRITAIATLAVAVVLASAALALVLLVRAELFTNLDDSLEQRADALQTSFTSDTAGDVAVFTNSNGEDRAAQLMDADGNVVASTPNLAGAPPLDAGTGAGGAHTRTTAVPGLDDDEFRVLSRPVDTAAGPATLHVVQNIDDLDDAIRYLTIALIVAVPAVVAMLAALVWWLVGRTLRPVEAIRTEVADISGTDLERRVAVPEHADEIAKLASTMNEMLDRISSASRRQRQFVADASHELRTPLTRIRTELEVDRHQPASADPVGTSAHVLEETIELQHLLDNLLFLARSDERAHPTQMRRLDLDDVVLREVAAVRTETDIAVDTSAVSAAGVIGDRDQLARMTRNLLTNAGRHGSTSIEVALATVAGVVRLSVTDDGPGVPPAALHRIFERFGRSDDVRARADGGAGLGLAIVLDIVRRHGGSVRYDETWTDGARFVVDLPLDRSDHDGGSATTQGL